MSTEPKSKPPECPESFSCTWREWSQHILAELKQLREDVHALRSDWESHARNAESRISRLEVKAGVWGALAGFLAGLGAVLVGALKGGN